MKKRRPPSSSIANLSRLQWKILVSFCSLLGLFTIIRCRSQVMLQPPLSVPHLSPSFGCNHFEGTPKAAFLFLARRDLPLDFFWDAFFKDIDTSNYSIYIHTEPGFDFNKTTTRSAFFLDHQLKNSVQVGWGESSMIEAERLLLETALQDPANQRFVLLSDSCLPLYNFSYIYNYLMSSPKSFIESFIDVDDRYSPEMEPNITKDKWRKGSQWIALVRRHAEIIVNDDYVFPVLKKFCKLLSQIKLTEQGQILQSFDLMQDFQSQYLLQILKGRRTCIPDEHYAQTLPFVYGLEAEVERRTLTYTFWNKSAARGQSRCHPVTFNETDATPQKIKEMKMIKHVYYKSEHRTEWCWVGDRLTPCFLFARKFTSQAAMRLLKEGLLLAY